MEKGVSQQKLAKAVGVDKRSVIFWEQGATEPKASYICRMAEYFDVTTDYLLGVSDIPTRYY